MLGFLRTLLPFASRPGVLQNTLATQNLSTMSGTSLVYNRGRRTRVDDNCSYCSIVDASMVVLRSRTTLGSTPEIATFAAGCFWGVEHIFLKYYPIKENKGILKTSVGYTGGYEQATNPDYKTVCSGSTNHAEALRIEFDPSVVKYEELVGEC